MQLVFCWDWLRPDSSRASRFISLTGFRRPSERKHSPGLLIGSAIAQVIGAPLSAALLNIHWFEWSGWRWLLVLEGVPATIAGIWTIFYLPDRPKNARWLAEDELLWLTAKLEEEKQALSSGCRVLVRSPWS